MEKRRRYDLVERDPAIARRVDLQYFRHVPGDRFPFEVRVCRDKDAPCSLGRRFDDHNRSLHAVFFIEASGVLFLQV
jgi:hypothetical protein